MISKCPTDGNLELAFCVESKVIVYFVKQYDATIYRRSRMAAILSLKLAGWLRRHPGIELEAADSESARVHLSLLGVNFTLPPKMQQWGGSQGYLEPLDESK